jgi:16S rRNA A1518/A1519 N6-dimethyltransferase RsmA/KsgA/DIM1 with predicted DNA glycosylase/AP lyase activity
MEFTSILSLFIALSFLGILISIVVWSIRCGIAPMPTSPKALKRLEEALPSSLNDGVIYELGSGWGTLAFPLARHYQDVQVIGYELSPVPFLFSKMRLGFSGSQNLQIRKKDFLKVSLGDAALIVCYLYPGAMYQLKEKFEKELKPGTWVVSNTFAIAGWVPERIYEVPDLYHTKIYLYRIP